MELDLSMLVAVPRVLPMKKVVRQRGGARKKQRLPFTNPASVERRKHDFVRHRLGLVGPNGLWKFSAQLQSCLLPNMPDRCVDTLHIMWLCLEGNDIDPCTVDQVWCLDQSLYRGKIQRKPWLQGDLRLSVPGFHVSGDSRCCPCVCPKALHMWVNVGKHFLDGLAAFRLQGVPVWRYPNFEMEDRYLFQLAGDGFPLPVIMAHLVVAFARILGLTPASLSDAKRSEPIQPIECDPSILEFDKMAHFLFMSLFANSHGPSPATRDHVTLGTLCSGTDFISAAAKQVGAPFGASVTQTMSCERCEIARTFRQRYTDTDDAPCFKDVCSLPESAPKCDLLVYGSSCRGLSLLNNHRRDLLDIDFESAACSSGNTMRGCLEYVACAKPRVVIIENVAGLLSAASNGERNIDLVFAQLREHGYECGYSKLDARVFFAAKPVPCLCLG
jgi:hypothetical protein